MLDFRRCGDCGIHFPRGEESCPACGRFGPGLKDLLGGSRLPASGGLPAVALLLAFFLPSPWGGVLLGAGMTPLIAAMAWLLYKRRQRDAGCFALRIREVEVCLDELERDLTDTGHRLQAAKEDLDSETRAKATAMLERELTQDRRLQEAQRRLVVQLERRFERLEIERFRVELRYYEACRDSRLDSREIVDALHAKLKEIEAQRLEGPWEPVLEEARLLHRQLARGVRRLEAARRLDPLAHVELAGDLVDGLPPAEEGELHEQMDRQLERIERGFDAVDELTAELLGDPDASGIRLRVDDDMIAALDEVELEIERERISVESL